MYYIEIKEKAIRMRRAGKSLSYIVEKLHVAKSTASFWCKDIVLPDSIINKIKTKGRAKSVRGLLRYSEQKRKERIKRKNEEKQTGVKLIGDLSNRELMLIGIGLYWGEGYKYENSEFGFTNSNPYMIRFYLKWLKLWNIERTDLIFRLSINELFRKKENKLIKFWVSFLEIRRNQFSKTTFIKTNLKKGSLKNMENYKGVLRVKVRKGTSLRNKVIGAIEYLSSI